MFTMIVCIVVAFALLIAYIAFAVSAEAEYRARKMREKDNERRNL